MLEAALVAGITSAGGDAFLAGIVPTPTVALLIRELAASGGVVISASHNPPEYNGIKFFDAEGFKLTPDLEDVLEERLQVLAGQAQAGWSASVRPIGAALGTVIPLEDAGERYIARAVNVIRSQGLDLAGLRIAVDCGHGASFATTPETLRRLGATVEAINTNFDGNDINVACGSTHLEQLKALVISTGADVGLAHDGDADRMLAIDEAGNELDGDVIEAICAVDLKEQGRLACDTVVSTIVCNLGFMTAMRERGIEVVQTAVGDRHVLDAMRTGGFVLGGEQSGHTILLDHNTTGDGLASALQLLAAMKRAGMTLGALSQVMTRYPQIFVNVRVTDKEGLGFSDAIAQAVSETETRLGAQGRVLIRASGTEPLVRVMVEAADEQIARDEAQLLASVVERELG
jgi:phosphoglucosamine mutase